MTSAYIDSASLHQVIQCFDAAYADQYPWSLQTATQVTALLLCTSHQHIAPGLAAKRSTIVTDQYDDLVDALMSERLLDRLPQFDDNVRSAAIKRTKQWIARGTNLRDLSETVSKLHMDSLNFRPWIEWSATRAWHSHSTRLNGLFDATFAKYIAEILNLTSDEVAELHRQSLEPKALDYLISQRNGQHYRDFNTMSKAYVTSAILRGKYHDELAQLTKLQITHHPIRTLISQSETQSPIAFPVSNTLWALATLVIHGAASQRRLSDRVRSWVDNIVRVKPWVSSGREEIGTAPTDHAAVDVAVRIAREAGIQMGDGRVTVLLDLGMSLGIGVLTHIVLSPWLALPAAATAERVSHQVRAGEKLSNAFHLRGQKLRDLAAGRITSGWRIPNQ